MPHLPVRSFVVLGQYDICHSYPSLTWYFCVKTQKSPPPPSNASTNSPESPHTIHDFDCFALRTSTFSSTDWAIFHLVYLFTRRGRKFLKGADPLCKICSPSPSASCAYRSMHYTTPQCSEASWTFRSISKSVQLVITFFLNSRSW